MGAFALLAAAAMWGDVDAGDLWMEYEMAIVEVDPLLWLCLAAVDRQRHYVAAVERWAVDGWQVNPPDAGGDVDPAECVDSPCDRGFDVGVAGDVTIDREAPANRGRDCPILCVNGRDVVGWLAAWMRSP